MQKLRLYAFCNFYLNSISQGIQTAHVLGRMAKFYRKRDCAEAQMFWDYLEPGNETVIVLNGGMAADVEEAYLKFENMLSTENIPSGIFYEEPRALGSSTSKGAPTCWAVVLPERLYDAKLMRGYMLPYSQAVEGNDIFGHTNKIGDTTIITAAGYGDNDLFSFLTYKSNCGLAR